MASPGTPMLAVLLSATLIGGCGKAQKEFERQLEICSAGERNGVLTAAAEGCGKALDIARQNSFPPDDISDLSFRLGQIERMRGRFEDAEGLVRASLDFESQKSDSSGIASRLIELSISLAGQNRWEEGASLLARAEPHVGKLEGDERKDAVNTLRGYAAQLDRLGDSQTATQFRALALELGVAVNENTAAQ